MLNGSLSIAPGLSANPKLAGNGVRTDRLAYLAAFLPGMARGQRRASHGPEGTHEARVHSDHAEYVWWRDDGLDARSSWESREAGDGALMDASGRQRIG